MTPPAPRPDPASPDDRPVMAYCAAAVLAVVLVLHAPPDTLAWLLRPRMLALHLVSELFAVCIAAFVVVVSWHTLGTRSERGTGALITGFTVVVMLDLMHALTYAGMPAFINESGTPKAVFFWLAGRTAEFLALATIACGLSPRSSRGAALALGIGLGTALVAFGSFALDTLPATFIEGQGVTPFKVGWEYVLCAGQVLIALRLRAQARATGSRQLTLLALGSFTMGIGEIAFTAYVRASDFQNLAGHLYKLVAYGFLYRAAFLASLRAPYDALAATEARVRERDESFRMLGANLPGTVLFQSVAELDGTRRFTQLSDSIERVSGLRAADVLRDGELWRSQIIPEDRPLLEAAERHARQAGRILEAHLRIRRADGRLRRVALSAAARALPDGRTVFDGTVTDITEQSEAEAARLLLEQQLREAQKMESIGTLASGIAHDFNNVVGAILGNVALVEQDLANQRPEAARRGLAQIAVAGRRARDLVRQIMAFGRRQPLELSVQPLEPLVDEALGLLRATLPAGVAVRKVGSPRPLPVTVDATQMQQVLMNLCTNAWHAMKGRPGLIEVGLEARELSAHEALAVGLPPGTYADLRVEDNGCGMDEATRARAFEPFFTTKPVGEGTGLGLSVVHGIVSAHRGAIQLRSEPGVGTRFDIWLPLATSPGAEPARAASRPAEAAGARDRRVLMVDDDPVLALMIERLLRNAGFDVVVADSCAAARAAVAAGGPPPDAVVTDYNMPDGHGVALVRELRERLPGLPAVVCSGYVSEALRSEAAALGDLLVVEKQRTVEDLVAALDTLPLRARVPGQDAPQSADGPLAPAP